VNLGSTIGGAVARLTVTLTLATMLASACGRTELLPFPVTGDPIDADPAPGDGSGTDAADASKAGTADLDPPCDPALDTSDNCGACRHPACSLANVRANCDPGPPCQGPLCWPGFGNCDAQLPDCETSYTGLTGSCLPTYSGTLAVALGQGRVSAVAIGAGGATYVAGSFTGTVDFDPTAAVDARTAGSLTPFITRMDFDGTYAWTRVFAGGGDGSEIAALAPTLEGDVFAFGTLRGTIDVDPTDSGVDLRTSPAGAPLVLRISEAGTLVWARTFAPVSGVQGDGVGQEASRGADGGVYLLGQIGGTIDFDQGQGRAVRVAPPHTPFVAKLTGGGDLAWVDLYELSSSPSCLLELVGVAGSTDGRVWLAGNLADQCDLDPGAGVSLRQGVSGREAGFALPLDGASGAFLDQATLVSGSGYLSVRSVAVGPDGRPTLAGWFSGSIDFDPGPGSALLDATHAATSSFVLRLDPDGAVTWVEELARLTIAPRIVVVDDGGVLLTGRFAEDVTFVAKIGADQRPGWTLPIGDAYTQPASIAAGADTFVVAGIIDRATDLDPGAATDVSSGPAVVLSRYRF
jgi:hypothetical protein